MSNFDRLHPALQHHIVNSLGWSSLRPLQEATIEPVLAGEHAILLAPTAGGKTEAAMFPVLSRMLSEDWAGLSVLYICPIKALLNNLSERLNHYTTLIGRRSALWHGDVRSAEKGKVVREHTDILLTTPESIEGMLVSSRINHTSFFQNLRAVVIDEVHVFAGDDRGWHLLYLLERLQKIAGRELQRLGLSATVGNPDQLCAWLRQSARAPARVLNPPADAVSEPEVEIDYVGNLNNAALVISRLHRGEKRLVFCDSRSKVEQLATLLREREISTFVSHSSLSLEERTAAEKAFSEGHDCVIVATSTLELGVDVGDLDRVIQIDAPPSVASFLQRIGRAGRRAGTRRNCLLLNTNEPAFIRCIALLQLWAEGFVEPIEPPALPFHIFAQQIMALVLQERGIAGSDWQDWLSNRPGLPNVDPQNLYEIVDYMKSEGLLHDDGGVLGIGEQGHAEYGNRHFSELLSAFTTSPLFNVFHGRSHLGEVHHTTFVSRDEGPTILTLGGRSWQVEHIQWSDGIVYVKPSAERGKSRWRGDSRFQSYDHCQAVVRAITENVVDALATDRAIEQLADIREEMSWLSPDRNALVNSALGTRWWTFGGTLANLAIEADILETRTVGTDEYGVSFEEQGAKALERIEGWRMKDSIPMMSGLLEDYSARLKFSSCLPENAIARLMSARYDVGPELASLKEQPTKRVNIAG